MKKLDNYYLDSILGKGYSGTVYLARTQQGGQQFAIKVLNKRIPNYHKLVKDTQKEAIILQQINSNNVVQIIDFQPNGVLYMNNSVVDENVCYVVLELAQNGEIFDVIFETGALKGETLQYYIRQLLGVFEYLHSNNIVHRDIKPENILLDQNFQLKLTDFGFSTIVEDGQRSKTVLGTERYMSPEILSNSPYDAKRSDIFSLGVVFYVLAKGNPPFIKSDINQDLYYKAMMLNPRNYWANMDEDSSIEEPMRQIILSCLQHNPLLRPDISTLRKMEFFNTEIDEQKVLQEMKQRAQQSKILKQQKILQQQIELQSGQYRDSGSCNSEAFNRNLILLKKCEAIKEEKETSEDFNIKIEASLEQLQIAIAMAIERMPKEHPLIITVKEVEKTLTLSCEWEMSSLVELEVLIHKISPKEYGLQILKTKGDGLSFYQLKPLFLKALRNES